MTLRLKRLEIQGFKSFANRTVFDLSPGLTAVIGPNGSGKSNLSEAVRWVLGEQSNLALRGRRGEDVIFAGGSGRAALGMAEVALTLDNSDGELPLEFSEVTIARRIFRDGDTHYLINGGRVRLRDLLQITASLGQSYTVIGQGLVDAALSARPDERRGLFEHAAGIAPYRLKRIEAERRLAETDANCARLLDLRAELEPRLRSLERSARHAQEYGEARERLRGLQERLFADLWRETTAVLRGAEANEDEAREAREAASVEIARLLADAEASRAATETQSCERQVLAAQVEALARRLEPLRRQLAIGEERLVAIRRRRAEAEERAAHLVAQREAAQGAAARAEAEIGALDGALAEARGGAETLERELAGADERRTAARRAERDLGERIAATERERLALARRRAIADERRTALTRDRDRATAEHLHASERVTALTDEQGTIAAALQRNTAARDAALAAEREGQATLQAALAAEREAAGDLTTLERRAGELRARVEGLQKLAASGEGFFTGVRAVLAAARSGELSGVVGPIASVLTVPAEVETAIEVALGGHLQDIVVERWADAEAAIALLKARRVGRATFQPLDTVRGGGGGGAAPSGAGIVGVAADLVRYDDRYSGLMQGLLGRVLVVEDLPTTRRVLSRLSGGWSIVTRGGEIARTSGAVTGGAAARESGILARERTLRELPRALATAEREVAAARAVLDERAVAVRTGREALAHCERLRRDAAQEGDDLRHRLGRFERDCRAVVESLGSIERQLTEYDRAEATLGGELAALDTGERDLAARLAVLERERAASLATAQEGDQAGQGERSRLTALRAEAARAEEGGRGLRRELAAARNQEIALVREVADLTRRGEELVAEERTLVAGDVGQREAWAAAAAEAAALTERLRPLDAALVAVRRAEAEASAAMNAANEEALRREAALGGRAVETARRRAEREALARRIAADLEVEEPEERFAVSVPPLPTEERMTLEGQVERLAARLRRLGPPNPETVAEWESEAARWKTLTEGLADVESATRSLRAVLAELDRTMAERFNATFARVAEEFTESCTDLFGGGSARLVLGEAQGDGVAGVEIIAQPPGKKLQSLSLLSGGERALTAAALLFAILRVNPSPFCVLDEVDAALDESNVVRFRERLKRLAEKTQFVVITHNRTTIEGANTLYGITMGTDGVSRALSLRLGEGAAQSVAD